MSSGPKKLSRQQKILIWTYCRSFLVLYQVKSAHVYLLWKYYACVTVSESVCTQITVVMGVWAPHRVWVCVVVEQLITQVLQSSRMETGECFTLSVWHKDGGVLFNLHLNLREGPCGFLLSLNQTERNSKFTAVCVSSSTHSRCYQHNYKYSKLTSHQYTPRPNESQESDVRMQNIIRTYMHQLKNTD